MQPRSRKGDTCSHILVFLHVLRKAPSIRSDGQGQHWLRGLLTERAPEVAIERFIRYVAVVLLPGAYSPASIKSQTQGNMNIPMRGGETFPKNFL